MDNRAPRYRPVRIAFATGVLVCVALPVVSWSAGVSDKVQAEPGDIVVLRNVPSRPATRQAPPGKALMINPKPNGALLSGTGVLELSDSAYAGISAGTRGPVHSAIHDATSQLVTELGSTTGGRGVLTGTSGSLSGAVSGATGGIGAAVTGAMAGAGLGAGARP